MSGLIRVMLVSVLLIPASRGEAQDRGMSPAAHEYLNQALDLMQRNARHSETIDWRALRREALERAAGAEVPSDTYDTIRWTLKRVNKHSSTKKAGLTEQDETVQSAERWLLSEVTNSK